MFSSSVSIFPIRLSPRELLEISQEISRNYAPAASVNTPRLTAGIRLSPPEILEISEEISRQYRPKIFTDTPNLVLLPVDPEHLYAYWQPGRARIASASPDDCREIVLRIYPQPDESTRTIKSWFDVVIDNSRKQQKVFLPRQGKASAYSAAIGERCADDCLEVLATAGPVQVPGLSRGPYQSGKVAIFPEPMLQALAASQESSHYPSKNTSGQGK